MFTRVSCAIWRIAPIAGKTIKAVRHTSPFPSFRPIVVFAQFSLGGGYAGFAFVSGAFQRRRSQGYLLSVAEPHARFEGEMEFQTQLLRLLERGCIAEVASTDNDGQPALARVSYFECASKVTHDCQRIVKRNASAWYRIYLLLS